MGLSTQKIAVGLSQAPAFVSENQFLFIAPRKQLILLSQSSRSARQWAGCYRRERWTVYSA